MQNNLYSYTGIYLVLFLLLYLLTAKKTSASVLVLREYLYYKMFEGL